MNQEVIVSARTIDSSNTKPLSWDPDDIRKESILMGGRSAAICSLQYDDINMGLSDDDAFKLARQSLINDKYFNYEHCNISFIIKTNKAMAMILNSTKLYATSERSARYNRMTGETVLEEKMYNKWYDRFVKLISVYYENELNSDEINNLAMENARYFTSVFTETVMKFTVPFSRAVMLCDWLDELSNNIESYKNDIYEIHIYYDRYYKRIAKYSKELATLIRKAIGISYNRFVDRDPRDRKDIGIQFYDIINTVSKLDHIGANYDIHKIERPRVNYGDNYTSQYTCSFSCLAQEERHRTISYSMNIEGCNCYIPKILKDSIFELEWIQDFKTLWDTEIVPQATLVSVYERGRFEDFYLKCKDRLCTRAQLEIMEITKNQVAQFVVAKNKDDMCLSTLNKHCLLNMVTDNSFFESDPNKVIVKTRCMFNDYNCSKRCSVANEKANYYRNI